MTRFARTLLIAGFALGTTLASSNLYACGGGGGYRRSYPTYSRPTYHRPVYSQPVVQPAPAPVQPIPQQPGLQPAPQTQPVAPIAPQTAPASADAQATALEALAQMTGQPAATTPETAAEPQTPAITGTWTARVTGGAVVQLTLENDGRFNWTATSKDGKVSTFQGNYTTDGGLLTLVRSSDNVKLEGTTTLSGESSFNFKLAGANDNGLDFVRG